MADLDSRLARYFAWEARQSASEYKQVRQKIVELFLSEKKAMNPSEIAEKIGYGETDKRGRARTAVYDGLRKLVILGVLYKSSWREEGGAGLEKVDGWFA